MSRTSAATSALDSYEPSLDGLRGICIAGVVAFHSFAFNGYTATMRGGFVGVSIFFTLSGFLITSLLLRERAGTGRVDLAGFWARRIRRLWPASFAVVLAVVVLSIAHTFSARTSDVVAATWSVTNWHVIAGGDAMLLQTIVGPLGPTWSLAVEEQFYVLLALLVAALGRVRRGTEILAAVAVAGIVVPVVLANVFTYSQQTLEFNTVFRLPELFAGVALALWYRASSRRPSRSSADMMAGVGLVGVVGLFVFADYTPPWLLHGGYALVAAVTAITIVGLLHGRLVPHALAVAPLRGLGTISYPLYLVHWPVILLITSDRTGLGGPQRVALGVAVATALAWVLHATIERPIRRLRTPPTSTIFVGLGTAALLTVTAVVAL